MLPPSRLATGRLRRPLALWRGGHRTHDWGLRGQANRLTMMGHLERLAGGERVGRLRVLHLHLEEPAAVAQAKREPPEILPQPRPEAERPTVIAHAPEAGHGRKPGSRERRDMDPVAGVALEVVEIHQRGLTEVVVGKLHMADLGGEDGLRAGRQRRVAHGPLLVVLEVAGLLLSGKRVAA